MSFLVILSNQKFARAFMSTSEAIAQANFGTKTAGSVTSQRSDLPSTETCSTSLPSAHAVIVGHQKDKV